MPPHLSNLRVCNSNGFFAVQLRTNGYQFRRVFRAEQYFVLHRPFWSNRNHRAKPQPNGGDERGKSSFRFFFFITLQSQAASGRSVVTIGLSRFPLVLSLLPSIFITTTTWVQHSHTCRRRSSAFVHSRSRAFRDGRKHKRDVSYSDSNPKLPYNWDVGVTINSSTTRAQLRLHAHLYS